MSTTVTAAIEVNGSTLRFAEVKRENDEPRVLRLGQRRFGLDVGGWIFRGTDAGSLRPVRTALVDVFRDTKAERATIVVHPDDVVSFFAPVSAEVPPRERRRQVLHQVALLTGLRSTEGVHLQMQEVRTDTGLDGESIAWLHVLVLDEDTHRRMDRLLPDGAVDHYDWVVSTEAVARAVAHTEGTGDPGGGAGPFQLAVGHYPHHTEYSLVREGRWYHSHCALDLETPQDQVYHSVALMNRLDVPLNEVGRLFVYGSARPRADGVFEAVFQTEAQLVRLHAAVHGWQEHMEPDTAAVYAPCVGAAL